MGNEKFRVSFIRSVLEALQRLSGGKARAQLQERLPIALQRLLTSQSFTTPGGAAVLSLDDAEELLLGIDRALGDGSGAVLESVGQELATRSYLLREGDFVSGTVRQCVERLGDMLMQPYENTETQFRVTRTDTGLNLTIGVSGRPRATRALRHLATGCVRASFTFALEATSAQLKIFAHTVGDRAEISARYRVPGEADDITPAPSKSERTRPTLRQSAPQSVAKEVARILSGAPSPRSEPPESRPYAARHLDSGENFPRPARLPNLAGLKSK